MKKRFLPIATAISAAALLAACSQTELIDDGSVKNNGTADNNAVTFSTYTAKKGGTRAGYVGNMTNGTLQNGKEGDDYNGGFGVFAYYTGLETYGVFQGYNNNTEGTKNTAQAPNFMYNQLVKFKDGFSTDEETGDVIKSGNWTYSPLKYWPNDFNNGDVDTQTPNAAQGSGENGGNVSFFAYAPYVEYAASYTGNGITGMTSNSTTGDPKITYTLPSDVDLLWGTYDNTNASTIVTGQDNSGVQGNKDATDDDYKKAIVDGKYVAADLTKQKVDGQVKFNFIHALAGIGGSTEAVDPDYDEDDIPTKSGFKVMLDIDNSEAGEVPNSPASPAISGGSREMFKIDGTTSKAVPLSEGDEDNESVVKYYRTIVTLRSVSITNDLDGDGTIETGDDATEGDEQLYSSGVLNLATGQWKSSTESNATDGGTKGDAKFEQIVGGATGALAMNEDIAEYEENTTTSYFTNTANPLSYFAVKDNTVNGVVENNPKNVYKDATVSPILLIPGQTPKFRITVEYVVRQYDDALNTKYTEVVNKIAKVVTFPEVKMNTHYTIIMRLGLTSVKFTAVVSDWSTGTGEPGTEPTPDGDDNSGNNGNVEILLPSNVIDSPQTQP